MTQEATRPVILQGGRLCGLPNQRVKKGDDRTEYSDDNDGRVYMYEKHHVSEDGVDVFRIIGVRPPLNTPKAGGKLPRAKKKLRAKKKPASRRDKKD